jgi:hypothetical protein
MNEEDLARIAQLAAADSAPNARALDPEVRSGSSFTFGNAGNGAATWPRFQVVWFYTVNPVDRDDFKTAVGAYETGGTLASGGVTYLGTYSVSISGAAPDFEYRTVWGLDSIGALQNLNDTLHAATGALRAWMDLIAQVPAMRTEIMGRTFNSLRVAGS